MSMDPASAELATLRALYAIVGDFADTWAELLWTMPDNYDCHMTCAEANAAADLFRALGRDTDADMIIAAHAEHDDEDERGTHEAAPETAAQDEDSPCMMVGCGHSYEEHALDLERGDRLFCQRCKCRYYLSAAALAAVRVAEQDDDPAAALAAGELAAAEIDEARSRERRSDSAFTGNCDATGGEWGPVVPARATP